MEKQIQQLNSLNEIQGEHEQEAEKISDDLKVVDEKSDGKERQTPDELEVLNKIEMAKKSGNYELVASLSKEHETLKEGNIENRVNFLAKRN